jgi:hypothetical protein
MSPRLSRPAMLLASAISLTGAGARTALAAASDAQLNAIEQQIRSLQAEVRRMKAEAAARDRAVKTAHAAPVPTRLPAAVPQIPAGYALVPAGPGSTPGSVVLARAEAPRAPVLRQGTFQIGALSVTLGGFFEDAGIYRSRNAVTDITSNLTTGIPLRNSALYHEPEFGESARRTAMQALISGDPDDATHIQAFIQNDFQGGAPTSNATQSNGWVPRLTQGYAEYARSDLGFYVLAGQTWSLLTMDLDGLDPRKVNSPPTIDGAYVPGFNWVRQPQLRLAKSFDSGHYWLGVSVESPQTAYANTTIPAALGTLNISNPGIGSQATGSNTASAVCTAVATTTTTTTTTTTATAGGKTTDKSTSKSTSTSSCTTANVASQSTFTNNIAPDIVVKATADYPRAHLEAYGIGRLFNDRLSQTGTGQSNTVFGGGAGAAAMIHIIPRKLDVQVSGLAGVGIGRYGASQLPDATVGADGRPQPIREWSALVGLIGHPTPVLDVYGFLGTEQSDAAYYDTYSKGVVSKAYGYGNPLYVNTSCYAELGASSTCTGTTKAVVQGTLGAWYRFLKGPYGTMQVGAQYSYTRRMTFEGVGGAPQSDENMVFLSFRYYPFQ